MIEQVSMWQMFVMVFVRCDFEPQVKMVEKKTIAKGKGGIIGNKGGMKLSFMIADRLFNLYSCHLIHKMHKNEERHTMMASLI